MNETEPTTGTVLASSDASVSSADFASMEISPIQFATPSQSESPAASETAESILQRLRLLYGEQAAPSVAASIEQLIARYEGLISPQRSGWSERDVFLITYGDSLLGDAPPLNVLHQ